MKRFVNGVEVDLPEGAGEVTRSGDRLVARSVDGAHSAVAVRQGEATLVSYRGRVYRIERSLPRARSSRAGESGEIFAPMPGAIADVLVDKGDAVENGQKLLVLEAMKTQQPFSAPFAGRVAELLVNPGDQVTEGQLLAKVEPASTPSSADSA